MYIYSSFSSFSRYVEVTVDGSKRYIFTIKVSDAMVAGSVGFSLIQRKWTLVSLNTSIEGTQSASNILANGLNNFGPKVRSFWKTFTNIYETFNFVFSL